MPPPQGRRWEMTQHVPRGGKLNAVRKPAHYAVPSAGINWGSLSEMRQKTTGLEYNPRSQRLTTKIPIEKQVRDWRSKERCRPR